MAGKPAIGEKSALNRMVLFELYVSAPAAGIRSLGPAGGFRDASARHFLKLQCLKCGEFTAKDVCFYVLEPNTRGCSARFGPSKVTKRCYPTCKNPAHLVRKCKNCGLIGSVEVMGVGDAISVGERTLAMYATCMGYKPMIYYPGPGWVATTAADEDIDLKYKDDGRFVAYDQEAGGNIFIAEVQFEFVEC